MLPEHRHQKETADQRSKMFFLQGEEYASTRKSISNQTYRILPRRKQLRPRQRLRLDHARRGQRRRRQLELTGRVHGCVVLLRDLLRRVILHRCEA